MITQDRAKAKNITVYIGLQNGHTIQIKKAIFAEQMLTYDDILARVILRGRSVVKSVFQTAPEDPEYNKIMEKMILKDSYILSAFNHNVLERKLFAELPEHSLVFYLDSRTKWKVLSKVHDLVIDIPLDVESLFHKYYENHYPPEVLQHAFLQPKLKKRVYAVQEFDGIETFFFEPILFDSDEVDFIVSSTPAAQHNHSTINTI